MNGITKQWNRLSFVWCVRWVQSFVFLFLFSPGDNRVFLSFSEVDSHFQQRRTLFRWIPRTTRIHNLVLQTQRGNWKIFPPNAEIENTPTHHSGELKHVSGFIHSGSLTLLLGVTYGSKCSIPVEVPAIPRYFKLFQELLLFPVAK